MNTPFVANVPFEYSIRFGFSSIASLALKQQDFEVGNLLGIDIPYCL